MSRILIVEDDQPIAAVLQEFLSDAGHEIDVVSDGAEAIDRVRVEDVQPNLIIMDLMMPRLTGGEAARILKREPATSAIPILAISGVGYAEDLADVLAVDAVLTKPIDLDDLRRQVDELLSQPGSNADVWTG